MEDIEEDDKYQYIDDIITLEAINLENKLADNGFWSHAPSDIYVQEKVLAPNTFESQNIMYNIALLTTENKAKLNVNTSKCMIFSKSKEEFTTRLSVEKSKIDRER